MSDEPKRPPSTASVRLSWRDGITAEARGDGEFCVQGQASRVTLTNLDTAMLAALGRLAPPGDDEGVLEDVIVADGGAGGLSRWYFALQWLAGRGLIVRSVHAGEQRLATVVPLAPGFRLEPVLVAPDRRLILSRFAYLRCDGGSLVLESPRSHARVILHSPAATAVVATLATPGTAAEAATRSGVLGSEAVALFIGLLASAGMIAGAGPDDEEEAPALRSWEFHDLLFHARSRKGRSDAPFGATYRPDVGLAPPPAFRSSGDGAMVDLFRPDLARLERDDPPLARVMETRASLRNFGDRPLTVEQLGEFLYRVARAKGFREIELEAPQGPLTVEFASRPFPAGGALYELEFYVAVNACDGLDGGLYHYDPRGHRLETRCGLTTDVKHLVDDAALSAAIPAETIHVLIILAARFRRLSWKYASIAYALTLKHVGVVYQTMYLAATAMGLAPCALGGGDSDLFTRAAGVDYYDETSVGEFLLGSRGPLVELPSMD